MAAKTKPKSQRLEADPRWLPFVERYAFNLYGFAAEACQMDVTPQQADLFDAASPFGSRVSVSSGHGTGKTRSFGVICLWHLLCYMNSNTYVTAPKLKTVREGVWKEITTILSTHPRAPS